MTVGLKLESPCALPDVLRVRLKPHHRLFQKFEYLDDVLKNICVCAIAEELSAHLQGQPIHAYHCTKEPFSGFFETRGLRLTDVAAHQKEFLDFFGSTFTSDETEEMRTAWHHHFVEGRQLSNRNGLVWLCISRPLVKSQGAAVFFKFMGGESIFKPLTKHPTIASKLQSLGRAVVVEAVISGGEIKYPHGLAKYVLSVYHSSINPDAFVYQAESCIRVPVLPSAIVCVTPSHQFN